MGTMVIGFEIHTTATLVALFARRSQLRKPAITIWTPAVGVNATNIPTAVSQGQLMRRIIGVEYVVICEPTQFASATLIPRAERMKRHEATGRLSQIANKKQTATMRKGRAAGTPS